MTNNGATAGRGGRSGRNRRLRRAFARASIGAVLAAGLAATGLSGLAATGTGWAGEPAASPGSAPRRIASINLCADQLVLRLADRDRIVSVSSLARDPRLSNTVAEAKSVAVNRRSAEEIVRLAPDLVVSGRFGPRKTNEALRRLGIPVFELDVAESIADVRRTIRDLAAALGVRERGEDMIRGIDDAFASLPQPESANRPLSLVYRPNGQTAGPNTLADDVMARAGLANLGARVALDARRAVSLETIARERPRLVIFDGLGEHGTSLAERLLDHPVFARLPARTITIPTRLWLCPGPWVAEAASLLSAAGQDAMQTRASR